MDGGGGELTLILPKIHSNNPGEQDGAGREGPHQEIQQQTSLQALSLQTGGFGDEIWGPQSSPTPSPSLLEHPQGFPAPTAFSPTWSEVQGLGWGAVPRWERGMEKRSPPCQQPLLPSWAFLAQGVCGKWFSDLTRDEAREACGAAWGSQQQPAMYSRSRRLGLWPVPCLAGFCSLGRGLLGE